MNPRENADDAYAAFMAMSQSQWDGLLRDLFAGGVLTEPEQQGFDRAFEKRGLRW